MYERIKEFIRTVPFNKLSNTLGFKFIINSLLYYLIIGSLADMIERFIKIEPSISRVIDNKKKNWELPNENEIKHLSTLLEILQPFREVIEQIQSEKNISICNVYTSTKILKGILNEFKV